MTRNLLEGASRPCTMWGVTMLLAILAAIALLIRPRMHETNLLGSVACHLLMAAPFFALASRFLVNDTSYAHVVSYGGEELPPKFRFAATWAAREGPLLLWVMWMTLLAYVWRKPMKDEGDAHQLRLRFVHGFSLLLLLVSQTLEPFQRSVGSGMGTGLNELLQTDLMVIHPPLIFLAYSFCIHLGAVSLSSMFSGETNLKKRMLQVVRPGLLVATLGIGLGGLWAYLILDWGGYWAWDPVETGSLLPWLALVFMSHLRTRPGTTSAKTWIGAGIATGGLALFATLVTRAGGVWASSVHTFVIDSEGAAPQDAFSRMMILKSDPTAGVEVMTYLILLLFLIGFWLQNNRSSEVDWQPDRRSLWLFGIPFIAALLTIVVAWLRAQGCGEGFTGECFIDADFAIYATVPTLFFSLSVFAPLAVETFSQPLRSSPSSSGWSFTNAFSQSSNQNILVFVSLLVVGAGVMVLTENAFFAMLFLIFFTPLYYSLDATRHWALGAAGVVLGLAGAWSGMIGILPSGIVMLIFILPWLLAPENQESGNFSLFARASQQKIALWASVMVVGIYLILTLVLLLSSIDSINFEGHELYGTPFVVALAGALFLYSNRRGEARKNGVLLLVTLVLSLVVAVWQPTALGMDSDTAMSSLIVRGVLAWLTLPILLLVVVPMAKEVFVTQAVKRTSPPLWKRIPFGAHLVHFGLILLLIGHVFTTVLVDRGDASHRLTMPKNEIIIDGDFGYEFTGLTLESEGLEVGDGYVGIQIDVYRMDGDKVGEKIGTVEPGMLRFDTTTDTGFVLQSTSRSEVDTLSRWSGDLVFIFDGSQANGLMQQTSQAGAESVQLVRVTVYDLPASHLVWLGWSTMLIGMAVVVCADVSKKGSLKGTSSDSNEEE